MDRELRAYREEELWDWLGRIRSWEWKWVGEIEIEYLGSKKSVVCLLRVHQDLPWPK